jgi:hypothetical protein
LTRDRWSALVGLGLLTLALHGCATVAAESRRPPARRMTSDRVLIVPRAVAVENRPIAEQAASLMAHALRDSIDTVDPRQFQRESEPLGTAVWSTRLLERLERGGWPSHEEGEVLRSRHTIYAVMALEVTAFDQVWGRYGKFTRVGIVARMVDAATGTMLVDRHRELEIDEMRGRSFQFGMEQVVAELASTIDPRSGFSAANAWRFWRR